MHRHPSTHVVKRLASLVVPLAMLGLMAVSLTGARASSPAIRDYGYGRDFTNDCGGGGVPFTSLLNNVGTKRNLHGTNIKATTRGSKVFRCSAGRPVPAVDKTADGFEFLYFNTNYALSSQDTYGIVYGKKSLVSVPGVCDPYGACMTELLGPSKQIALGTDFIYNHNVCNDIDTEYGTTDGCPHAGWTPNIAQVGREGRSGAFDAGGTACHGNPGGLGHSTDVCFGFLRISISATGGGGTGATPTIACNAEGGDTVDNVAKTLRSTAPLVVGHEYSAVCAKGPDVAGATTITLSVIDVTTGVETDLNESAVFTGAGLGKFRTTKAVSMGSHWQLNQASLPPTANAPAQYRGPIWFVRVCEGDSTATLEALDACAGLQAYQSR